MAFKDKASSARWLLTLFSGIAFLTMTLADVYVVVCYPKVELPFSPEALFAIVSAVVAFYFSKPPETKGNP